MKFLFTPFLILVYNLAFGQTIQEQIKQIATEEQALDFIRANPKLDAKLLTLHSFEDTLSISQPFFSKKNGDCISMNNHIYKIIDSKTDTCCRVGYIYLDGSKLSMKEIELIRDTILKKYKSGISFPDLIRTYSMDLNPNAADFGWFTKSAIVSKFVDGVRQHAKGEIFRLDVEENKWYYVVLKTYADMVGTTVTVLSVKDNP